MIISAHMPLNLWTKPIASGQVLQAVFAPNSGRAAQGSEGFNVS
jgi:hypothetical protein